MTAMSWQFTPYTVPILLAGAVTFICATLLWRNATSRSRYAALLLWDLTLWMTGYALELTAAGLGLKLAGQNLQYAAGVFISLAWIAFITTYSGLGHWLRREVLIPLAIPSLASIALLATNHWHGLVAYDLHLDASGPFVLLQRSWGPWSYFIFAYTYLLLLLGLLLLARLYRRAQTGERRQTSLLIVGIVFPWIGSVLDLLNVKLLYGLDFTPFGFLLTGLVITWDILYHRFGQIIPASYELAVQSMSDGVIVADRSGRILAANRAAQGIFQDFGEALRDRRLEELIPPDALGAEALPEDARSRAEVQELELALGAGAARRLYNLRRSWVVEHRQPVSQVLVLRDVTELARSAASLREAKALAEEANRAKSEFLANMSHELRTPLHHIIGFTEQVAGGHAGELSGTQEEYLRDVLDAGRNLLALINDILEMTKIDSGMLAVNREPAGLKEALEGTLTLVREKALKHRIRVSLEAGSLPETVLIDVRKLKQVLFNLLVKAVSLCPDGGQVVVRVRMQEQQEGRLAGLELQVLGVEVRLSAEDHERIFQPFEQVKAGTDHLDLASGSGLALAKRLVELQAGTIAAEYSAADGGTVFVVQLPVGTPD
jgi:signal transduction histidine kinase